MRCPGRGGGANQQTETARLARSTSMPAARRVTGTGEILCTRRRNGNGRRIKSTSRSVIRKRKSTARPWPLRCGKACTAQLLGMACCLLKHRQVAAVQHRARSKSCHLHAGASGCACSGRWYAERHRERYVLLGALTRGCYLTKVSSGGSDVYTACVLPWAAVPMYSGVFSQPLVNQLHPVMPLSCSKARSHTSRGGEAAQHDATAAGTGARPIDSHW